MHNVDANEPERQDDAIHPPATGDPERLDAVLRSLGFMPDADDRLRRLELGLAEIALRLAETVGHLDDLSLRLEKIEAAVGDIRRERAA